MERRFAVVMDQGSSSSRALLIDNSGKIYCRSQVRISPEYPRQGRAEYDAEKLYQSQLESLKEVLKALPAEAGLPLLGIAAQRSTVVLWNAETGMPLCPAMSWQDGRAADITQRTELTNEQVYSITGLYKTPYYSASKIAWAIENLPAARHAAEKGILMAGPVPSYILFRLSGGKIFCCDPTFGQRMLLMNIKTAEWDNSLMEAFSIRQKWLPKIVPSSGPIGKIKLEGYEMTAMSMIGDQQSAMSGLGIDNPGDGAINYGTGAFLLVNTGESPLNIPGLLDSFGWKRHSEKQSYFCEAIVNSAGSMLEWMRTRFGFFETMEEADNLCRISKQRLFCLPAIGGLASPYWDFDVKTCITGLTSSSCKADIVRAAVEGIAFMIAGGLELIREKGIKVQELKAGGGLSQMSYLMQFQADITGARISVPDETEETAIGAAREAFLGARCETDFKPFKSKIFLPRMPESDRQSLLLKWQDFIKLCRSGKHILPLA